MLGSISPFLQWAHSSDKECSSPQRKPLLVFIHGPKSESLAQSLGSEYKIKVIRDTDPNFEATLLDLIQRCFHLIIDAQSDRTNPNKWCQFLSERGLVNFQMQSIFLALNNSMGKEGYSLTIEPKYDHLKICLKQPLEKISSDSHKTIFELFGEEDHLRFDQLRKQIHKRIPSNFFDAPSQQFEALESISSLELPLMRGYIPAIDGNELVRPYMFNEFLLPDGLKTSASCIPFKKVDPTCIDFIATHCPTDDSFSVFWRMIHSLPSTCVIQLNYEYGSFIPEVGVEMTKEGITLKTLAEKTLLATTQETLTQSTIFLKIGGTEKQVSYFWIERWIDGASIRSEKVLNQLLDILHESSKKDPLLKPVVFCTAGIGRTGTFLASYLIKHLAVWNKMNHPLDQVYLPLYATLFLRLHRSGAVGGLTQFHSLHRILKNYLNLFDEN